MKWSLFNWKKPTTISGEPEDYQIVKNTVSQNERNITNINSQITNVNNQLMLVQSSSDRNSQTLESLETRVDRAEQSINNAVTTNTNQTITGAKTLSNTLTLTKTNAALAFKPGTNQSSFIEFYNSTTRIGYMGKASSMNNNIQIGSEFGDIVLTPATNNGIIIPEPRNNNNPATKQYVDNKETAINNQINTLNTFKTTTETNITNINNSINELNEFKNGAQGLGLNLRYQDLQLGSTTVYSSDWGSEFYKHNFSISTLQETKFLAATIHFKGQSDAMVLARSYQFTYGTTWGPEIWFSLVRLKNSISPTWSQTFVRIFYIDTLNTKTTDPYFLVEEENNEN